jgi:hypothetical protein
MKYDEMIKKLLEADDAPSGFRTFSLGNTEPEKKATFDYSAQTQVTPVDPTAVEELWQEFDDVIGRAIVNTDEDLKKYLGLTKKVLVVNSRSPFAAAIPAPIAILMFEKKQNEIERNILQYSSVLREYAGMAGVGWPVTNQHSSPFYITPFKDKTILPITGENVTNEQIAKLEKWVDWVNQKREESWIIAGTTLENLIIK